MMMLTPCVLSSTEWKSDVDVIEDHEVASLLKARGKTFELTTITVDNEEDIDELRTLLSLPVQEFTAATLKSSYKRSDWEEAVNTLRSDKGTGKVPGFLSVVLGQDVRNNEGYVLLSGWNSYEVRRWAGQLCFGSDEMPRRPIWRRSARRLVTTRICWRRWISESSTPMSSCPRKGQMKRALESKHVPRNQSRCAYDSRFDMTLEKNGCPQA